VPLRRSPLPESWTLSVLPADVGSSHNAHSAHSTHSTHSAPALPDRIAAQVPGTVHTDLLAAGIIPDPYLDSNELALDWIGRQRWRYQTSLRWTPDGNDHQDLVFEGLDTVATVLLDGTEIARTFDQHRTHRIPVAALLTEGRHELEVIFDSAWEYAENVRDRLGDLPNAYPTPFNFIRKMACNFGWDWGPTVVTAGIWRPVTLQSWSTARLSRLRPVVTVTGDQGRVEVLVDLDSTGETDLVLSARIGEISATVPVPTGQLTGRVVLDVPDVALWWPHDLGPQPLYDLSVELRDRSGTALDAAARRIGFRTVTVDTTSDEMGSAFTFVVNGVPIFVRGANWIPDDCFPSRITRDRLATRIEQATEANLNMLRVWGGGIYESDDFYDLCDERGVLVWQDFLFACAAYPEEEPLRTEVLAEARENVARLMPHPSLVMWNGCNENIWGYRDWDWKPAVGSRTWGAGYYLELLPAIVAELDPERFYYPGSPYSGSMDIHPNVDQHGLRHIWDVWNDVDYTAYRDSIPRFVAEFGYQAPPTTATLYGALSERPLSPDSPGMLHHQKAIDGNGKLLRGAAPHLPQTSDFLDWLYLMYVQQAEAIRFGIEHFRTHRGTCMGTIVWQLNDCWPVTSWAAVDGAGRKKLLWYALRDACASQLLTIAPRAGNLQVFGVNDTAESWHGSVTTQRMRFDGTVLASHQSRLTVAAFAAASISLPAQVWTPADPTGELLVATTPSGAVALHFFEADKNLRLPDPQLEVQVLAPATAGADALDSSDSPSETRIVVTATTLARHVAVLADRISPDAVADDALVTILPGRSHTFRVVGGGAFTVADLESRRALTHLAAVR